MGLTLGSHICSSSASQVCPTLVQTGSGVAAGVSTHTDDVSVSSAGVVVGVWSPGVVVGVPSEVDVARVVVGVVVGVPSVVGVAMLVALLSGVVSVVERSAVVLDEALHGDATVSEWRSDVKKSEWIRRRAILTDCCRVESNCALVTGFTEETTDWRTPEVQCGGQRHSFHIFPFKLNKLGHIVY